MKYVWLILLLVLVLLLCWPIRILFFARDNNIKATLKLYFFNITLYDSSKKKEKKQNLQASDKKEAQKTEPKEQKEEKSSSLSLDSILALVKSVFSGLGFLSRKLHFDKVNIDILAGKDEPDETAIFFGQVNSALYTTLGVLGTYFKISYDQVSVRPEFEKRTFLYKISFSFWALPVTILATAIVVGARFVILNPEFFIPNTRKGRK